MESAVPIARKTLLKKYVGGPASLISHCDGLRLEGKLIYENEMLFVEHDAGECFRRRTRRTYLCRRVYVGDGIGVPDPRWWDKKHGNLKHYTVM